MHSGEDIPKVPESATISQTILEITRKRLGMSAVVDADGTVTGVYTDGDLRRTLDAGLDPHITPITEMMTRGGKHIGPDALAVEAAQLMEEHRIQGLLVIDENQQLVGALNFQDLLKAGVV
jgi:arabinose-5-phosphate isomerase